MVLTKTISRGGGETCFQAVIRLQVSYSRFPGKSENMAGLDDVKKVKDIMKSGFANSPLRATVMVKTESGHGLNVRAKPNESSDKVGKLDDDQKVIAVNFITPPDSDYSWAAIYMSSDDKLAIGYVAAKYLVIPSDDPEGENNIAQSDLPDRVSITGT